MLTKDDVQDAINEVMDERARIDQVTHVQHHQFIEMQIEEYQDKKRLRESVKKQVIGWGVILALGGIGTAVYSFVIAAIAKGPG